MKFNLRHTVVIAALSVTLPALCKADIVYSNLGPGNTYQPLTEWTVGETGFDSVIAFGIRPTANYSLTEIDVGLTYIGGINSIILNLLTDADGQPGTLIESWTVGNLPFFGSTNNTLQSVTTVGVVPLVAGTQYWVQASPGGGPFTWGVWNQNSTGATGPFYLTETGLPPESGTNTVGALQILGTPTSVVPEPGSVQLLGLVLLSLVLRRRRSMTSAS
jgi:PEP-CTERM motif-containing protein